ncbi:MAG: mersacidin/lichenicidin family type 2 lantibiotic [Gomphosphaeria aponina SAG 52.96 = DSM 107014]|uniref:Mersacidin/lichenicidin family type 2 lantibiotic n=1 Tax=Gomphosphaeria aponina SAG 52.96 = DSM 107014 TaxID=1521640 RepID=A0A941JUZ2_9CHRO|nr:mersacidin/lichenicidin family type 2 lantibiotic [Gomphosphaeria aponina SAG 52.96 = DSM 107014]
MSNIDIIRAWKDEEYRESLSEAEQALLPENPAGLIELTDEDMSAMAGGAELAVAVTGHPVCHTNCSHCKSLA